MYCFGVISCPSHGASYRHPCHLAQATHASSRTQMYTFPYDSHTPWLYMYAANEAALAVDRNVTAAYLA
jgi:hypothetical protein